MILFGIQEGQATNHIAYMHGRPLGEMPTESFPFSHHLEILRDFFYKERELTDEERQGVLSALEAAFAPNNEVLLDYLNGHLPENLLRLAKAVHRGPFSERNSWWEIFFENTNLKQREEFFDEFSKETMIPPLRNFAANHGLNPHLIFNRGLYVFGHGLYESFLFRPIITKDQAKKGGVKFTMGEDDSAHEVTLTKPFEMQSTPVTQFQWFLVMGENPSHFTQGGVEFTVGENKIRVNPNHPVESVSWTDVQKFIKLLNEMQDQFLYRLPTEAEWEFAVRSGTTTRYYYGERDEDINFYGWSWNNSGAQTQRVAQLKPNSFELYDMYGNVWEWVQDWDGDLPRRSVTDPTGPTEGFFHVWRGGAWNYNVANLRSASRLSARPEYSYDDVGFRLVRELKVKKSESL